MSGSPFSPEVIAAVTRHMNVDHADDSLLICRALGGQPEATSATMTGMDADGIDFAVVVGGREVPARVPWAAPVTERAQVRAEVVRMYHDACEALGVPARPHGG
jgi:putative heme iron utilization protein